MTVNPRRMVALPWIGGRVAGDLCLDVAARVRVTPLRRGVEADIDDAGFGYSAFRCDRPQGAEGELRDRRRFRSQAEARLAVFHVIEGFSTRPSGTRPRVTSRRSNAKRGRCPGRTDCSPQIIHGSGGTSLCPTSERWIWIAHGSSAHPARLSQAWRRHRRWRGVERRQRSSGVSRGAAVQSAVRAAGGIRHRLATPRSTSSTFEDRSFQPPRFHEQIRGIRHGRELADGALAAGQP